ncbi:hypothetical protein LAG90_09245 [Marinilongibacter aquaticus]|uniref:hypothetical protein n=1 Tax=Marinilongibacter aquaticus TaxID=2975157 RepID=UPI0021BD011C|nr:hypothetical protein [Marinilongibacter aquaticus]UBM60820.1 hypothetical protein LAG90_09245 [Marinilongibacter aquaticus]
MVLKPENITNNQDYTTIAEIGIKDKGLSISCTLEEVIRTAQKEASSLGANAIIVKKIKSPDAWSTCYRILADAVYLRDVQKYQSLIIWDKERKLVVADFKADTANRPFEAATYSGFNIIPVAGTLKELPKLIVETSFDSNRSYLKQRGNVSFVLKHEQLHFDLSEIYARKFVERMRNASLTVKNVSERGNEIFKQIQIEMQNMNDLYDTEVYADTTLQTRWDNKIKIMLSETVPFEDKSISIRR